MTRENLTQRIKLWLMTGLISGWIMFEIAALVTLTVKSVRGEYWKKNMSKETSRLYPYYLDQFSSLWDM